MLQGLVPAQTPVKPEALTRLEQIEALGIPLEDGGIMDQPHIWLFELGIVTNERNRWQGIFDESDDYGEE